MKSCCAGWNLSGIDEIANAMKSVFDGVWYNSVTITQLTNHPRMIEKNDSAVTAVDKTWQRGHPAIKFFEVIHKFHKHTFVYSFINLYFPQFPCGELKKRTFVSLFFSYFSSFFDIFPYFFPISDKLSTAYFSPFFPLKWICG